MAEVATRTCVSCEREYTGPTRRGRCNRCRNREAYHADLKASRARVYKRAWYLRRKYGLDQDAYDALLDGQGGACAICGGDQPGAGRQRFHVDHDHKCCDSAGSCGECIRGLLCNQCNVGLAFFRDNPSFLMKAIEYLGGDSDRR